MKTSPTRRESYAKRQRILLVDDEPDIVRVLQRGFEMEGFQADAFDSPQKALDAFKPGVYDFAILDIRMPGINGFMLYRRLREQDPELSACFLSAFEIHQNEFKKVFPSMANSVKWVIKKPVTAADLISEISPMLKTASLARAASGDHLFVVYETSREFIDAALEFLRYGVVEKNEDAILVTNSMTVDELRARTAGEWCADVSDLESTGRLAFYTFRDWYMPNGKFDLRHNMAVLSKRAKQSIARGRNGLRIVGDTNPFFESGMSEALLRYEGVVGKKLDLPIIAVCAYSNNWLRRLDDTNIRLLYRHHSAVVGEIAR